MLWDYYLYVVFLIFFTIFSFIIFFLLSFFYNVILVLSKSNRPLPYLIVFLLSPLFKFVFFVLGFILGFFCWVNFYLFGKYKIQSKFIIIKRPGFIYFDLYGFLFDFFLNFIFKHYFYSSDMELKDTYIIIFSVVKKLSIVYTYSFYFFFYLSYCLRYYSFLILNFFFYCFAVVRRFFLFEFYIIFYVFSSLLVFLQFIFCFIDELFLNYIVKFKRLFLNIYFLLSYFFYNYLSGDTTKVFKISGSFLTLMAKLHWPRFFFLRNLRSNRATISVISIIFNGISFFLFT